MASNITLSAGVRQNLLSLQNTADLMSTTQNRLATGKKVNSALDNPTSFFTAQSLQSRAGDMASLLDGMTAGVKTLEAADNGLSAITKTVESMQSTLRQARQDKSFKTGSYDVTLPGSPVGTESLTLTGGSLAASQTVALTKLVGGAPTSAQITGTAYTPIDFTPTAATAGAVTGTAFAAMDFNPTAATAGVATFTFGSAGTLDTAATIDFTVTVDGGAAQNISITQAEVLAAGNADSTIDDAAELRSILTAQGITGVTVGGTGTDITLTSSTTGTTSDVVISAPTIGGTAGTTTASATTLGLTGGVNGVNGSATGPARTFSFDVEIDGGAATTVTINAAAVAAVGNNNNIIDNVAELQSIVDAQLGAGVVVGTSGGALTLTSATTGLTSSIDVSNVTASNITNTSGLTGTPSGTGQATGAAKTISFDLTLNGVDTAVSIDLADVQGAGDLNSTLTAAELVGLINGQVGSTVASVVGGAIQFNASGTGPSSNLEIDNFAVTGGVTGHGLADATNAGAAGGATVTAKTVDELVSEINADTDLKGFVRASNDNGKLRIENISTSELTVGGVNAAGTAIIGSGTDEAEIGGNTVRTNLVKQFNELRDQLDKLADDASFNGVNLLRGDLLKLTFNETGTSTIEIQAKDEDGVERAINSSTLGIDTATDADFDNDAGIDGILDGMKDALGVLRAQSSSFGSNLSIVQNRTEFTKSMINTLQTGADSLVLADTNEEAANMLALQTRQQLSSTALSLASQADQAVLRLF